MDVIDQAQLATEQYLAHLLGEHARRRPTGHSRTHCEDCGQPIPEDRRRAAGGCTRCLACQQAIETHTHWSAL